MGVLLDPGVHRLWLAEAAEGRPPPPRLVAEMQYGLTVNWHHEEAFLGLPLLIQPSSPRKSLVCREESRGAGKSTLVAFLRLYIAEYVLPFIKRPGLAIRAENRNYVIFGRDQNHLRDDIITPLKELVISCAPWLRTTGWEDIIENVDDPDPEGLREIGEMKSRGSQKWESFRVDLTNGVSFRTRTIKQSARGLHVFVADMDDVLTEETVSESPRIFALIQGAILPALEPGGMFILDGTPQGPGDLFDLVKGDPSWDYLAHPAYDSDGSRGYAAKNAAHLGDIFDALPAADRACLWPARMPFEALEQARGRTRESEVKFLREYMLERIPIDTMLVHPEDIVAAKDRTRSYHHAAVKGVHYYGGLDPSSLKKDQAGIALGHVEEGNIVVPDFFLGMEVKPYLEDGEGELLVVEELNKTAKRFGCYRWMLEKNGFQGIIRTLARKVDPSIRIDTFHLGSNKHTENGWKGVKTVFQSRLARLPYKTAEDQAITERLIFQLNGLQVIDGKIVEDTKRKNDLVSAFFLMLKAIEEVKPVFSATPLAMHPTTTAGAVQLPGQFTPHNPAKPMPRGELQSIQRRRMTGTVNQLQRTVDRVAKWSRRP